MNIESQVVNLELSKKLHELDVKQESLFYWCKNYNDFYDVTFVEYEETFHLEKNESLPNVAAKMLIHLLENNLMELK